MQSNELTTTSPDWSLNGLTHDQNDAEQEGVYVLVCAVCPASHQQCSQQVSLSTGPTRPTGANYPANKQTSGPQSHTRPCRGLAAVSQPAWWFQRVEPVASSSASYFASNGHAYGYGGLQQVATSPFSGKGAPDGSRVPDFYVMAA